MRRRRFLALLGLSGFAAVASALGCGSDDDDPADGTPDDPEAGTPPRSDDGDATPAEPTPDPTVAPGVPEPEFDPDFVIVVDKDRALPDGYVPPHLDLLDDALMVEGFEGQQFRRDVLPALEAVMAAAEADGHAIRIRSAYRSYEEQEATFDYWIEVYGDEEARRRSAPPGHSEHQLGTAVDFASESVMWELSQDFGDVPEGQWLQDHAHHYGFALSYPEDGEAITGYIYEPWHWRYVGLTAAAGWRGSGLTLVEYLEQQA